MKRALVTTILLQLCFLLILPTLSQSQDKEAYLIGPRDVLTLKIYAGGEEQREVDLTVSDQNMINVPFIGPVKTTGLTISQLEVMITEILAKDYFVNPQVHVHIKGYHSLQHYISVEGEIKRPGVYDYRPGLTALNACIVAGGFDKYAAANRARIIRREGKKQVIIKINLNDVREGKIPDIELKPGDRIHIPETWL